MKLMEGMDDGNMIAVFKEIYKELEIQNCKPKLHVLDNHCSKAIKSHIRKEKVNIQLVKPYNHRVSAAEPAVKTAKYHIIAGLGTVNVNCPLQLWCQFLTQMQDLLNTMRTLRRKPNFLASEELNSTFDYSKIPMSILGTKTLA